MCALGMCGLLVGLSPMSAVNRTVKPADYAAIEKRNPFGLVDPPKPEPISIPPEPVEEEPPPNVELTGMFHDSLKRKTYALFLVQVQGEQKKRSYMLSEGENQDGLKVEKINRNDSNVKINLKGMSSTITYNKPKAVAVAKGSPLPRPNVRSAGGRTTSRGLPNPTLPSNAAQQLQPPQQPGVRQYQTSGRQGTFSGSGRSMNAVAGGMPPSMDQTSQAAAPSGGALRPIPTRQLRAQPQLSVQEQEVLIEAQRAANDLRRQQNPTGLPPMPPLPPTSITTPETLQRITVPPVQR